jgi:sigma-B regulation protein RsbU (phosphoserine phosphatase)
LARRYTVTSGHFITAFYAVFDPAASAMTYANAGHVAPRASTAGARQWVPLPTSHGLPLGVMPRDAAYPEQTIRFGPGDRVAVFTDGVDETDTRAGEPFGPDRLDAGLGNGGPAPDEVVAALTAALDRFTNGQPVKDDQTLVVVRRA